MSVVLSAGTSRSARLRRLDPTGVGGRVERPVAWKIPPSTSSRAQDGDRFRRRCEEVRVGPSLRSGGDPSLNRGEKSVLEPVQLKRLDKKSEYYTFIMNGVFSP